MQRDQGIGIRPVVPQRMDIRSIARHDRARDIAVLLDDANPTVRNSLEPLFRRDAAHDPQSTSRPAVIVGWAELPGQPHNQDDQFLNRRYHLESCVPSGGRVPLGIRRDIIRPDPCERCPGVQATQVCEEPSDRLVGERIRRWTARAGKHIQAYAALVPNQKPASGASGRGWRENAVVFHGNSRAMA